MSFTVPARRAGAIVSLAALSVLGAATAASAHVTANPKSAEQGSYAKVSFRVPNERDNAATTKVVVHLPVDHPLASVSVRPTPGWTVKAEKSKLPKPIQSHGGELTEAVTTITWSGGKIEAGRFEEFDVSMGPLPTDTDQLMFKADQTYSNGEVVKWEEAPAEGAAEPEHPAPTLQLTPKGGAATVGLTAEKKPAAEAAASSEDGTARLLGGIGIAVGVVGLGLGGYGLSRARSRA
ncbi:YcnI family protein [Actinomadura sp. NAK00032]|uniref:YcnI family copper-binding membrane protein n=1 Tax=Actinomadura sp. NAK00032 TaxID=2742128 RepID=UPI00158FB3C7|nr:YcnI family protein [Actinomadura sp. NAK00032]QKW39767.1 YcnI family protein [Actinomadura sp. NAK00032]